MITTVASADQYKYALPAPLSESDFIPFSSSQAELGQLLFYDKVLSGNRNVSCGTCHHHRFAGSDGLSLGIGEGGEGVGPDRTPGIGEDRIRKRIPRNAPSLWNLGAKEIHVIFHDGRLTESDIYETGFDSPAEERLPLGLTNLLAAQALLPMTSQFEMAGNPKENEVAGAVHDRIDNVWPILSKRVRGIEGYGDKFVDAFDHISSPTQITIVEIAEALAAFIGTEWKSFDSPFDDFLAGDKKALSEAQTKGMALFYGKANCAQCHSGSLLTDQGFYALALPPFGPGRTRRFDPFARDVGLMGSTDRLEDAYRFRTPSLRNVEHTFPYGHNGAYDTLEGIIRHHLDPQNQFDQWMKQQANLPHVPWFEKVDFVVQADEREMARVRNKIDIKPLTLTDGEVADLVAFMTALSGKAALDLPLGIPKTVPSGLSVDR